MARHEFAGGAAPTTLAGAMADTDLSFTVTSGSGYPTGATGPFVITVGRAQGNVEKILCASRTGNSFTIASLGDRGYDGTTRVAHSNGEEVTHGFDATAASLHDAHVNDPTRDDHTQYLNTARHDVTARHTFGAGLPSPAAPASVGTAAAAGSAAGPSRADHTHILGTGSISAAAQFASGVVDQAARSAVDHCRAYNNAAVPIADNNDTVIGLNAERVDVGGLHSTSANTSRLTAQRSGLYTISANVRFAGSAVGRRKLIVKLNGATEIARSPTIYPTDANVVELSVSTLYDLVANDYVEMFAFQTSGGPLDVQAVGNFSPELAMAWLGP